MAAGASVHDPAGELFAFLAFFGTVTPTFRCREPEAARVTSSPVG